MDRRERLCGLYAISPEGRGFAEATAAVEAVLANGARLLQYRRKATPR